MSDYLEDPNLPIEQIKDKYGFHLFCHTCKSVRFPRSHHCAICQHCSDGMDHHCVWMNSCVGYQNHRYFLSQLVYLILGNFLGFYCYTFVVPMWLKPGFI